MSTQDHDFSHIFSKLFALRQWDPIFLFIHNQKSYHKLLLYWLQKPS